MAFDPVGIPEGAADAISRNLPDRMSELAWPLLSELGAHYTIDTTGLRPGTYPYVCMPHMAMGMTGTITVAEE